MRLKTFLNKSLLKAIIAILLFLTVLSAVYYIQFHHRKKMVTVTDKSGVLFLPIDSITVTAIEIETSSNAFLFSSLLQFRQTYLQSKINYVRQKKDFKKIITSDKLQLQKVDSL
jgi:hypothetical protein